MLGGGGVLNWSFIQAGMCDEVSVVIAPVADGSSKTPALFNAKDEWASDTPVAFELQSAEIKDGGNVTFEPGCRNNWHIHHKGGQILLCTAGRGYYQEWGKEAQELHPGDVVNIPPEVKHWHGAAKDSWFAHLAVEVPAEGASNEWLEVVNEEDYEKLK